MSSHDPMPVGTVTIRTRHKRGGEQRAWVKIAQPNRWIFRAQAVWSAAHGPVPKGMVVHHRDEDTLNDAIDNLELLTKMEHLDRHRSEFQDRGTASWIAARRAKRWSTKSKTKRTGRHPQDCNCEIHA